MLADNIRTQPDFILQQFSLGTRSHKSQTRNYVSAFAENGPAMAGPVGQFLVPMQKWTL